MISVPCLCPKTARRFGDPISERVIYFFVSSPKARYTKKYDIALRAMIFAFGI